MHHEYPKLDQSTTVYEEFHYAFLLCVMSMHALDRQKVLGEDELHGLKIIITKINESGNEIEGCINFNSNEFNFKKIFFELIKCEFISGNLIRSC